MVNKNLVIAYLTIFMQGTAELYKNHSHWTNGIRTRTNEIYRKFIQLVVEHYTTEHSVSFYAAQLNLSLPHFCTTIKKAIDLLLGNHFLHYHDGCQGTIKINRLNRKRDRFLFRL